MLCLRLPLPRVLAAVLCALPLAAASCKSSVRQVSRGPAGSGVETQPLLLVAIAPPPGRIEVGPQSEVRLQFSTELDASSLGTAPVAARNLATLEPIAGAIEVGSDRKSLIFHAPGGLPAAGAFSIDVAPTLSGTSGGALAVNLDPAAPRLPAFYATFSQPPQLRGTLRVVDATSSSVAVEWDAASDNSSPDGALLRYHLHVAPAPDPIDFTRAAAHDSAEGALAGVVTRLEPGVEYRIALRASDALGNLSAPSNEVTAATQSTQDRTPPAFGGIVRLDADPQRPAGLKAVWDAGEDAPAASPLTYNVYVSLSSGEQDFEVPSATTAADATEIELTGLTTNTEHFVVVRAMDAAGNEDQNTIEAVRRTPASFGEDVFKILTLPRGYDASLCWPPCTNFTQPGGCARGGCHSGGNPSGGLNVQSHAQMIRSDSIVPGDPGRSLFVFLLRTTTFRRMPRGGTCNLGEQCIQTIERWIADGALNN